MRAHPYRPPSSLFFQRAAAAAVVLAGALALHANAQETSRTASPTSPAEMSRGVPGIDVDVGVNRPPASTNGVPGVDVDVRAGPKGPDVYRDERIARQGRAGADGARRPIQDRN